MNALPLSRLFCRSGLPFLSMTMISPLYVVEKKLKQNPFNLNSNAKVMLYTFHVQTGTSPMKLNTFQTKLIRFETKMDTFQVKLKIFLA